jgi:hypothetical protein
MRPRRPLTEETQGPGFTFCTPFSDDGQSVNLDTESPASHLAKRGSHFLEHETGLEPATPTLARRCWP